MSNESKIEALRKRYLARVTTPKGNVENTEENIEAKHGIENLKHIKNYNSAYFSNYHSNTFGNVYG